MIHLDTSFLVDLQREAAAQPGAAHAFLVDEWNWNGVDLALLRSWTPRYPRTVGEILWGHAPDPLSSSPRRALSARR